MKFATTIALIAGYAAADETLDFIDGIERLGEGLQEIADSFYENPEAFLGQIEETLVVGCW